MDQNVNANPAPKGAGFLKVVGILMIIFGGIGIIGGIVALLAVGAANVITDAFSELLEDAEVTVNVGIAYVAAILMLLAAVFQLVSGIIGVINAKKPEKAGLCLAWGIVVACMAVLGTVFTIISGEDFPVFSFLINISMPVLFIIGAALNKKA